MMEREDWKEIKGIILTVFSLLFMYFVFESFTKPLNLAQQIFYAFLSLLAGACLYLGLSAWIDARIEKKIKEGRYERA